MERLSLHITHRGAGNAEPLVFDVPDMPTALIVTEINMTDGTAEIFENTRRLARLRKAHSQKMGMWEVE